MRTLLGSMLLVVVTNVVAQEKEAVEPRVEPAEEKSAFDKAGSTITQMNRWKLDARGNLAMKKDHWETAAKRFKNDQKTPGADLADLRAQIRAGGFRNESVAQLRERLANRRFTGRLTGSSANDPYRIMFNDLKSRAQLGNSSSGGGRDSITAEFSGRLLSGELRKSSERVHFQLKENQNPRRMIRVTEDKQTLSITLNRGDGGFVQITSFNGWFGAEMKLDDEVSSENASSFAALVQGKPEFAEKLSAVLREFHLGKLPIPAARNFEVGDDEEPADVPDLEFPDSELSAEDARAPLGAIASFRIVQDKLELFHFGGDTEFMNAETRKLRTDIEKLVAETETRWRKQGVPEFKITEMRNQFDGPGQNANGARGAFGGRGGMFVPPAGIRNRQVPSEPEAAAFEQLKSLARMRSASGGGGGQSYEQSFTGNRFNGTLATSTTSFLFKTNDEDVQLQLRQTTDMYDLTVVLDGGFVSLRQFPSGSCMAMRIGEAKPLVIRGDNYIDLVTSNDEVFRSKILSVFEKYGVSGLDPFSEKTVAAVFEALKAAKADAPLGITAAYTRPLLKSSLYLQELSRQQPEDNNKKRIIEQHLSSLP